jgi:hypothetical protein
MLILALLGLASWQLEMRERNERLTEEALASSQVLDAALEERLHELDAYRHDLAALLQELDLEQVRAAEEQARGDAGGTGSQGS